METEPQIIKEYVQTGKVKIMYRHLLQLGLGSLVAAEASECAGAQGKFWQMHDLLYARGGNIGVDLAAHVGLDAAAFQQCLSSHQFVAAINADNADAVQHNIIGRPYFMINGTPLIGSQAYRTFQTAINAQLK